MDRSWINVTLSSLLSDPNIAYFARPILKFEYKPNETVVYTKPAKDFIILYNKKYNEKYISDCKEVGYLKSSILASVLNYVLNYVTRRQRREKKLWKICVTFEINEILRYLKVAGLVLPPEALLPGHFGLPSNLLAEQYYDLLINKKSDSNSNGLNEEGGFDFDSNDGANEENAGDKSDKSGILKQIQRKVDNNNNFTSSYTDEIFDEDSSSENIDTKALSALFASSLAQAINSGQLPGNMPLGLKRFVDAVFKPEINWKQQVLGFIKHIHAKTLASKRRTYSRVARQEIPGIILPGRIADQTRFGFLFDVSGSMSDAQVSKSLSEMLGCLRQIRAEALVWSCDTELHYIKKLKSSEASKVVKEGIKFIGGGGTEVVECLERLYTDPKVDAKEISAFIVFTDGYTHWPTTEPVWWSKYPTIVVLLANQKIPKWVRSIMVKE